MANLAILNLDNETYNLVKLGQFSNYKTTIYSLIKNSEEKSLYEEFIESYVEKYEKEVLDIHKRLKLISDHHGARYGYFKHREGKPGDGVCALFDKPSSHLRLYCIRYGKMIVILGGGGFKSKKIKALQEDKKLTKENKIVKIVSETITERLINKEIKYSKDGDEFLGNLTFNSLVNEKSENT